MTQIQLPEPAPLSSTLAEAMKKRASSLTKGETLALSLKDVGTLLGHSLRKRPGLVNRNYPSGGALYPIETYIISTSLEGFSPGAYHYNPTKHVLERLWDLPENFDMKNILPNPGEGALSTLIIFTGIWKRSSAKYGDFAYILALLEAGHMSENILLTSAAGNLNALPMSGFIDSEVSKILDLKEENEQPVHTIIISKPV
jgi:SagB-type dehydrogenase family enzyme